MAITRGFTGRRNAERDPRLPPGQYDAGNQWPVLNVEVTPQIETSDWTFRIEGLVERPMTWTWDEMHAFPQSEYEGAIHCVTTWSKFDMEFEGVSADVLFELVGVKPNATHVMIKSSTGYTTNLPVADVMGAKAWVAWSANGEPLTPEHGGPARFLVPHLYFWKSAKWVSGIEFLDHDEPGFWEQNGYHDLGDPWREQRYQGD